MNITRRVVWGMPRDVLAFARRIDPLGNGPSRRGDQPVGAADGRHGVRVVSMPKQPGAMLRRINIETGRGAHSQRLR